MRSPHLAVLCVAALVATACSSSGSEAVDPSPTATAAVAEATEPTATPEPAATPDPTVTPAGAATVEPAETPTPLPTPTVEATTAPEPTATPAEEATAAPVTELCTAGLAGTPIDSSEATADLDGDGAADQVTAYSYDDGGSVAWRLRVDTAAGESLDSPLRVDPGQQGRPIGGADVDGDGATHELFTIVGTGAAAAIVALHVRDGCDLVAATIDSAPAGIPVGGSVVNLAGAQCLDTDDNGVNNTVVIWSAVADADAADGTYDITGVEYELRGSVLREVGQRTARANVSEADFVYANLTCQSVNLGG